MPPRLWLSSQRTSTWLLERQIQATTAVSRTPLAVLCQMRLVTAAHIKQLATGGALTMGLCERIVQAERAIVDMASSWSSVVGAGALTFPDATVESCRVADWTIDLPVPVLMSNTPNRDRLAAARDKARSEAPPTHPVPTSALDLCDEGSGRELLRWMKSHRHDGKRVVLEGVQQAFYTTAIMSFGTLSGFACYAPPVQDIEAVNEVACLFHDMAREHLCERSEEIAGNSPLERSELLSAAVLVAHVAFCLTHAAAAWEHPELNDYGVPLCSSNIEHLVLSNRLALDAAMRVCEYLSKHTKSGYEVFTTRKPRVTAALTAKIGSACEEMVRVLDKEREAAKGRIDGHWEEVKRKQALAARYRNTLQLLEQELAAAKQKEVEAEAKWKMEREQAADAYHAYSSMSEFKNNVGTSAREGNRAAHALLQESEAALDAARAAERCASQELTACQSARKHKEREVSSCASQLREAEKAPQPVYQPLPEDTEAAMAILVLLRTAADFTCLHLLGRSAFFAQQTLLPTPLRSPSGCELAAVDEPATDWASYFNSHQRSDHHEPAEAHNGSRSRVIIGSDRKPPAWFGPKHVDECVNKLNGVWWPDELRMGLFWEGPRGKDSWHDPFASIPRDTTVQHFAQPLPHASSGEFLDWAVWQPGGAAVPADRGNAGIAARTGERSQQPMWMTKPDFLALCSLRAYPCQQLHRLSALLHDRTLPLASEHDPGIIRTIVRQVLHHVGELVTPEDCKQPLPLWKAPLLTGRLSETLHVELSSLADELKSKPRDVRALHLLGEMAAWLSEYRGEARRVAVEFAKMAMRWGNDMEEELAQTLTGAPGGGVSMTPHMMAEIREQQCRQYTAVLVAFSAGEPDDDEVGMMIDAMVLTSRARVLDADQLEASTRGELDELIIDARAVMARHFRTVCLTASLRPDLLTRAVKLVLARAPLSLEWVPVHNKCQGTTQPLSSVFEAVGAFKGDPTGKERLFTIDVLSGAVLLDGRPPLRLPGTVVKHPLYRRVFGDINFEVTVASNGIYGTARPVRGCHYEFHESSDLRVWELDATGRRLELLPHDGPWSSVLHPRLRLLHSH